MSLDARVFAYMAEQNPATRKDVCLSHTARNTKTLCGTYSKNKKPPHPFTLK